MREDGPEDAPMMVSPPTGAACPFSARPPNCLRDAQMFVFPSGSRCIALFFQGQSRMCRTRPWFVALLLACMALLDARASMIQGDNSAACTTDACCLDMYRRGVKRMPWCVADVVVDTQAGGCRVVQRCASDELCAEEKHECIDASSSMAGLHISSGCSTCDLSNCNPCDGRQCNISTCECEQVNTTVVCPEGKRCFSLDRSCIPETCSNAADCTSDGIFCNGAPACSTNNTCVVVAPCESSAPLCSEDFQTCNAICISDADCALPKQTFCDNFRQCDVASDFCIFQSVPRCNPVNETCDPLNELCVHAPPAPIPAPQHSSLVNGSVLAKWVLIIWLFTFVGGVLCAVVIWLSQKPRRDRSNSATDKGVKTNRRR